MSLVYIDFIMLRQGNFSEESIIYKISAISEKRTGTGRKKTWQWWDLVYALERERLNEQVKI